MDSQNNRGRFQRRIKQHIIAKEHTFFAIVQPGFEETCRRELESIGGGKIAGTVEGGVTFRSKLQGCYRANLCSRTASRVLMRLTRFRAARFDEFRKRIASFPWELYIEQGISLSCRASSSGSRLYHTERIEEECLSGISERLAVYKVAMNVGGSDGAPVQKIHIRIDSDECTVSLDSSGALLYRRDEKIHVTVAPLRETLASLILIEAGLTNYDILLDPMCGSGTFALEGAEILLKLPPGRRRGFAFIGWPCFSAKGFEHMKRSHEKSISPLASIHKTDGKPVVYSSDIEENALETARRNIERAELTGYIDLQKRDFFREQPAIPAGKRCLIALNPPYGARLSVIDSEKIYRSIGRTIRDHYRGCGYAIITPSLEHEKILSLPYDRKILFMNGGIKVAAIFKDGEVQPD